ncbi:MAG: flotillin family protein, partial [Candidatus Poseidoniaceae archaeon]|nr:flotillin family protein [Candidatus Poseidoniaceae archaeon]
MDGAGWLIGIGFGLILILFVMVLLVITRYKRCASDEILVVYGRVKGGRASRCIHGGATMVWPLIQDYKKLSLIPMTINIPLTNALSQENIRINVPSTFTVGISTDPTIMNNAAERLLHLTPNQIEAMASEIIFGQLRLTVASLTIRQINSDRDQFFESIRDNVGHELNKLGLNLINVNITDITDDSDFIESIG